MELWFWIWLVAAVVLSVAEMFTAGFFMLPFGIGAAVAAVLAWTGVPLAWQWVAFLGISVALLFLLRRFADRMTHEPPMQVAGDRLIGRTGVVIESIDSPAGTGRVRVDREEWRADAAAGGSIEEGARVTVKSVVGTHLVVDPLPEQSSETTT
jgi:membrane protein implicated in regulation of membrane protease activity